MIPQVVLERRSDGTVVMDEFVKSQIAIFSRNLASSLIKQGLQNHVSQQRIRCALYLLSR